MSIKKWGGRALSAALIPALLAGCDFIEPVDANPNLVPEATATQLFIGIQLNGYFFEEGQASRLSSVWMQQMDGTDRQFDGIAQYDISEGDASGMYSNLYTGGGLIDIRQAISLMEAADGRVEAGILKVYEAYFVGMAASLFGDIAYSQAVNPEEFPEPALDGQRDVYTSVLALLDEAIADLGSGQTSPQFGDFAAVDFAFGGDADSWIAVANTIKARFNLHWVEAEGNARYSDALAAAQNGILSASGDWYTQHSTSATENALWYQFQRDRSGYISAGKVGVDVLLADSDPRLTLYYSKGTGCTAPAEYCGSAIGNPAGDPKTNASNLAIPGYGAADFDFPIMTCAENYLIMAEAQAVVGTEAAARTALDNALACEEAAKGVDLSAQQAANDALTGAALFQEIMMQKYKSLFLNREYHNDYKRTCIPDLTPATDAHPLGPGIPGRIYYDNEAREANDNIVDALQQPIRNANDPNPC